MNPFRLWSTALLLSFLFILPSGLGAQEANTQQLRKEVAKLTQDLNDASKRLASVQLELVDKESARQEVARLLQEREATIARLNQEMQAAPDAGALRRQLTEAQREEVRLQNEANRLVQSLQKAEADLAQSRQMAGNAGETSKALVEENPAPSTNSTPPPRECACSRSVRRSSNKPTAR